MTIKRTKQILTSLVTILSLFVSAVSACACTHHEPPKKAVEKSSCHGSTHETVTVVDESEPRADSLETVCNCFGNTPAPAVVAKSDEKRSSIQQQVDDSGLTVINVALISWLSPDPPALFDPPQWNYRASLLSSLPSRAPPRL